MSRARTGASVLEFALMLPVLVVLAAGVAQWGMYLRERMLLARAAREAVRAGAVTSIEATPAPAQVAEARARAALDTYGLDGSAALIETSYDNLNASGPCDTDDTLTVVVAMPTQSLISIVPMPAQVVASMTMIIEDADCI